MGNTPTKTFWQAAARHRDNVTTVNFVPGQPLRIDLPKSGYKSMLEIKVFGTIGVTAGTVTDSDALSNWFTTIGLKSSQGGYLAQLSYRDLIDWNYRFFKAASPFGSQRFGGINAGATSTQNIWVSALLPISINDGINVETGLLNTQNGRNTFTLELYCAQQGDLVGSGSTALANFSLQVQVNEIYYDAVDANPDVVAPKFNAIVKTRTESHGPLPVGTFFDVPYPVNPTIIDAMVRVVENGAAAHAHADSVKVVTNFTQQVELRKVEDIREENYRMLGKDLRNGLAWINYCDDGAGTNETRMRDWINSLAATQLDFLISTTAAFNATSSRVDSLYREVVPLAVYG